MSASLIDFLTEHGGAAALVVVDELRRRVRGLFRSHLPRPELLKKTRALLARYEPMLARVMSDSLLAAWIAGANEVGQDLNFGTEPDGYEPPNVPDAPIADVIDGEPVVRFPAIEAAAKDMLERQVVTRQTFDALANDAKRAAFTIARTASLDGLEKIKQALASDVSEGGTLAEFRDAVGDALGSSALGAGHVENVYRTNIASVYTSGMMEILSDPLVGDEFPYLAYYATHDARTRPDHLALETMGLDGTNVYRRDDPIWQEFLPPWDYQCRCAVVPFSVEDAAKTGVLEAMEWIKTGIPPAKPAFVARPAFSPPKGWVRQKIMAIV